MQFPATILLLFLVLFLQSSSGYMTRGSFPSTNGRSPSRDFDRVVGVLPTGTRNSLWSLLSLEDGPVQARTRQSVNNLAVPVISKYDLQTVRELKESVGNNVEGETDHEIVELLTGNSNFNNVPSMNGNKINKRQLPILRLGKGLENPEIRATEDWVKHYSVQHGGTFVRDSQRPETDHGRVKEAEYSEDTKENKREPSLLRLGKRQIPMLRLGKRQLPMLRLGKRQLPMLRLGKRQLPMLRLGKRQLPMLRLGKRQLPMLRLSKSLNYGDGETEKQMSKSLNYGDGETEKQILDILSFDTPESELLINTPDSELLHFHSSESRLSR